MNISRGAIGQLAGIFAFISFIPYLISIFKKKTRPARASYAIWSVVEVVWVVSYISSGATTTKWTGIVFAATAVLIFLLSLKYGMGGYSAIDLLCLILAVIAITIWITTKNPHNGGLYEYSRSTNWVRAAYQKIVRVSRNRKLCVVGTLCCGCDIERFRFEHA